MIARQKAGLQLAARIAFLCALVLATPSVGAREAERSLGDDLTFIITATRARTAGTHDNVRAAAEMSPLGLMGISLITVYQQVISSEDKSSCNFSPSCSHFASDAICSAGAIRGVLMAIDRIQRCQPYSRYLYKVDSLTGKAYDPVSDYVGDSL